MSFVEACRARVLVQDGAMGTMLQAKGLTESDFRGEVFADHHTPLKGNNDVLNLTRPDVVKAIHLEYLEAGADVISTNTFNGTSESQADFGLADRAYDLSRAGAEVGRQAVDEFVAANPGAVRFVAGSVGPTSKTLSVSPSVEDPAARNCDFDELVKAYTDCMKGLVDGGADVLLLETIFDSLNAKAAAYAYIDLGRPLPLWISSTLVDKSGRTLSGQTLEAFIVSLMHAEPVVWGINCALGATEMAPFMETLSRFVPHALVSVSPNAGLPNEMGSYDETPEEFAQHVSHFAVRGLVNIVGGCCGTSPRHIELLSEAVASLPVRKLSAENPLASCLWLSGLEPLKVDKSLNFANIGERCNVAGSLRYKRLINTKDFDQAGQVARDQVESGAQMLDFNFDDGLIDGVATMGHVMRMSATDPEICKVPFVVDSSKLEVIREGLRWVQGRCLVNSISLKAGEAAFLEAARLCRLFGAAAVVMAFDEEGQADSTERRVSICERAYGLLVDSGFRPVDIVFDVNVLTIATGMPEHNHQAVSFMESVERLKVSCPGALFSGGVSNLSFAFRGLTYLREAMHSVFLYHAIQRGLDMAIVNAGALVPFEDVPGDLRSLLEDVVLNRRSEAVEQLITRASEMREEASRSKGAPPVVQLAWRELPPAERLHHALLKGIDSHITEDVDAMLSELHGDALSVIQGPLMSSMGTIGELFGAGKMFLPQVIKSARVMKKAFAILVPHMEATKAESTHRGTVVLATVKGDVHDIGKNIVAVVLGCNNVRVVDLGVMVTAERIVEAAKAEKADVVGLSGLITPSLDEMRAVAELMNASGLVDVPLMVGGATTSKKHTAVKLQPVHKRTVHALDASKAAVVVGKILGPDAASFWAEVDEEYAEIREDFFDEAEHEHSVLTSLQQARLKPFVVDPCLTPRPPLFTGLEVWSDVPLATLIDHIDWRWFFTTYGVVGKHPNRYYPAVFNDTTVGETAKSLFEDARRFLQRMKDEKLTRARAVVGIFPCSKDYEDILVLSGTSGEETRICPRLGPVTAEMAVADGCHRFGGLRQQSSNDGKFRALSDFVQANDFVGLFVCTGGDSLVNFTASAKASGNDDDVVMADALADRLSEALAEVCHREIRSRLWGFDASSLPDHLPSSTYQGVRPAPGYPCQPDLRQVRRFFEVLRPERVGIQLTESNMMSPAASVSSMVFAHPQSEYFQVGMVDQLQAIDYGRRNGFEVDDTRKALISILHP